MILSTFCYNLKQIHCKSISYIYDFIQTRHKKKPPNRWLFTLNMFTLDPEVSEGFIGLGNLVGVFFFLESSTFTLACSYDLIGQFICH